MAQPAEQSRLLGTAAGAEVPRPQVQLGAADGVTVTAAVPGGDQGTLKCSPRRYLLPSAPLPSPPSPPCPQLLFHGLFWCPLLRPLAELRRGRELWDVPLVLTRTWGRGAAPRGAGGAAQQGCTGTELLCVQGGKDTR